MKKIIVFLIITLIITGCEENNVIDNDNSIDNEPKQPEITENENVSDLNEKRMLALKKEMESLYKNTEYKQGNTYITKLEQIDLEDKNDYFKLCDKDSTYFSLSFFSAGPITRQYRITLDCSDNEKIISYFYNDVELDKIYTDFIDRDNLESD